MWAGISNCQTCCSCFLFITPGGTCCLAGDGAAGGESDQQRCRSAQPRRGPAQSPGMHFYRHPPIRWSKCTCWCVAILGGFHLCVCVCVFNIVCISDSGLIWWQRRIKLVANLWNDQECFPASDGPGLMDPCEKEPTDVLDNMVPQDREEITVKAQVTAVWARVKRRSATRSRGDSAPGPETASREQPQPPTSSLYRSIQLY